MAPLLLPPEAAAAAAVNLARHPPLEEPSVPALLDFNDQLHFPEALGLPLAQELAAAVSDGTP
jgi:hypothetical protein